MKNYIIIPARIGSTRLERKMLLDETGKPLIQHTYENAEKTKNCDGVFVATPDKEIHDECKRIGLNCIQVKNSSCGTHACLMAAQKLEPCNVINVQGDAPNVSTSTLATLFKYCAGRLRMASLFYREKNFDKAQCASRSKVVLDHKMNAMYYSRSLIPYGATEWNLHIGVYAFPYGTWQTILNLYNAEMYSVNKGENLEQLLWLEMGIQSYMLESEPCDNIDTREDYDRFKRHIGR